jgi:hypothetical protein
MLPNVAVAVLVTILVWEIHYLSSNSVCIKSEMISVLHTITDSGFENAFNISTPDFT